MATVKSPDAPPPSGPPPGGGESGFSDQEELREALVRVRIVLDDAVNGPEPLVSPRLLPYCSAAWPDTRAALLALEKDVMSNNMAKELQTAGLAGPSLRLKTAGLRGAFSRLLRGGVGLLRKNLGYFLNWSNTILGSLASVIAVAEIVKEYKECIENDLAEQAEQTADESSK